MDINQWVTLAAGVFVGGVLHHLFDLAHMRRLRRLHAADREELYAHRQRVFDEAIAANRVEFLPGWDAELPPDVAAAIKADLESGTFKADGPILRHGDPE